MRLTPKKYINYETNMKYQMLIISIVITLTGAILCGLNGLFPFFLFFRESFINIELIDIVFYLIDYFHFREACFRGISV